MDPTMDLSKYMNPSPPDSDEDDFNDARVTLRLIPRSILEDEYSILLTLYEDELRIIPDSDDSETSSSENDNSEQMKDSLANFAIEKQSNSTSAEVDPLSTNQIPDINLVKIETLSDGEIPSDKETTTKEVIKKKRKKRSPQKRNRLGLEYSDSDESDKEPERNRTYKSKYIKQEPETEVETKLAPFQSGISASLNDFFCEVCNIVLNSETTLATHLIGKRHKKALNAQNVPAAALESLAQMSEKLNVPYNYPVPGPRRKFVQVQQRSKLQSLIDDYTKGPLAGLSFVTEINFLNEVRYYCNLCNSPCSAHSIMQHLMGKNHRQQFCDMLDKRNNYKTQYGQESPEKQLRILLDFEKRYGREKMRVEQEVADDFPDPELHAPCNRNINDSYPSTSKDVDSKSMVLSSIEDLDRSRNDFYCMLCDSHMNNQSMWEAHVIGKRHLKNKKKVPGEPASKIKAIAVPLETAHLMKDLEEETEPIVGLGYITETQGEAGDFYNCFLCGACVTTFDIKEHLKSTKHRLKYLQFEKNKGQDNAIDSINSLYVLSTKVKDDIVKDECIKVLNKYGPGKVSVYKSKEVLRRRRRE